MKHLKDYRTFESEHRVSLDESLMGRIKDWADKKFAPDPGEKTEGGLTSEQEQFLDRGCESWAEAEDWSYDPQTGLVSLKVNFDCGRDYKLTSKMYSGLRSTVDFGATKDYTPPTIVDTRKLKSMIFNEEDINVSNGFLGVKFEKAEGNFNCYGIGLGEDAPGKVKGLEGSPRVVEGDFNCSRNDLKSLKGGPEETGGTYDCSNNPNLTSFEGAPKKVGEFFVCEGCGLENLKGVPEEAQGYYFNKNKLKSLEGIPKKVRSFYCSENPLKSLEGGPEEVRQQRSKAGVLEGGDFIVNANQLESLAGAPKIVEGNFTCHNNPLKTLEGAPETIKGWFKFNGLQIEPGRWTIGNLVREYLDSRGKEKDLLRTLVSPEKIQERINKDPEKSAVELKGVFNLMQQSPEYKGLVFPKGLETEADLLSDLEDIGL